MRGDCTQTARALANREGPEGGGAGVVSGCGGRQRLAQKTRAGATAAGVRDSFAMARNFVYVGNREKGGQQTLIRFVVWRGVRAAGLCVTGETKVFRVMGFDRGRRGRGRDKRDGFGEEGFDPFIWAVATAAVLAAVTAVASGAPRQGGFGGGDRGGFGGPRQGGFGGGGAGGGPRGGRECRPRWLARQRALSSSSTPRRVSASVAREDGGGTCLSISAVERAGLEGLPEGQVLEFLWLTGVARSRPAIWSWSATSFPLPSAEAPPQRQLTGERATRHRQDSSTR